MRILVCIKRVPAPGARINITSDLQQVDTAYLGFTISPHEECAVEQAVQLVEKYSGEVTVLTLGPLEAEEQLRTAISTGVTNAVLIATEQFDWDPQRTATAMAAVISGLESKDGQFDLIIFGNESADSCGFQVGIRVAHKLGRPMVNGAKGLEIQEKHALIRRQTESGIEIYRLPLPAAVGVKEGINLPRYPTMKGRLASKKATIVRHVVDTPQGQMQLAKLRRPAETKSNTLILGEGPEAAPKVVDLLEELGLLQ